MINKKTIENMKNQTKVRDEVKSEIKELVLTNMRDKIPLKGLILSSLITCAFLMAVLIPMLNKQDSPKVLGNSVLISVYAMGNQDYVLDENFKNKADKKQLIPSFKIKLAKYSKIMSSVPGIPVEFDLNSSNVDEVKISSEDVDILTIDEQTSIVDKKDNTCSIKDNSTLYFNPKWGKTTCTINIISIKDSKEINTYKMIITEKDYEYFAHIE